MKSAWMLPVLLAAALPLSAVADKDADPGKTSPPTASQEKEIPAQKLADKYQVPLSSVQGLRDKGLGWGEINNALAISRKSGQPLSEIMKLRESGMGWGQIARKYGFKLGDVIGRGHERGREKERGLDKDKDRDHGHDKDRDHDKGRDRDHDRGHRADVERGTGRRR